MSASTHKNLQPFYWLVTLLLLGGGGWYAWQKISLEAARQVVLTAEVGYIGLSIGLMVGTLLLKAWRWQWLLAARPPAPPLATLFWAMMLGQYVNLVLPFLRLGEIARTFALDQQVKSGKVRTLGSVAAEKIVDLLFLLLTFAGLFPFVLLPDGVKQAAWVLAGMAGTAVLVLSLLLWQPQQLLSRLPAPLRQRVTPFFQDGLAGLAALKDRRLFIGVVGGSAVIALLAVLTPYTLFLALHLPLGLVQAALLHVVVTLISTPPSTPGKIGVFNASTAFVLYQLGIQNETAIFSYSLLFHLVVILPQLAFGLLAAGQTGWQWQKLSSERLKMRD